VTGTMNIHNCVGTGTVTTSKLHYVVLVEPNLDVKILNSTATPREITATGTTVILSNVEATIPLISQPRNVVLANVVGRLPLTTMVTDATGILTTNPPVMDTTTLMTSRLSNAASASLRRFPSMFPRTRMISISSRGTGS
jgi:hypothetical protein